MNTNTAAQLEPLSLDFAGNKFDLLPIPANFNRENLIGRYWASHPRYQFFKSVPANSRFLDIGAGSGGLAFWKHYGTPDRGDIQMYGVDLTVGEHSSRFVEFKALNLDSEPLPFESSFFDVVYASHLIEHVNHLKLFDEIRRVSKPGALVYFETPTPESKTAPSRMLFRDRGYPAITLNFFDDLTHIETLSLPYLEETLAKFGFTTVGSGNIRLPDMELELLSAGFQLNDEDLLGFGLWSRYTFAEYIVARLTK